MKNQEIATMLREIAELLEIQEAEYKPRAYRSATRSIESLSDDVEDGHDREELDEIEGVGESIGEKIAEYLEPGELEFAHLGVAQARRGWCEASDVLNTRPLDDLLAGVER